MYQTCSELTSPRRKQYFWEDENDDMESLGKPWREAAGNTGGIDASPPGQVLGAFATESPMGR
jgi:hypothetical protein